MRTMRTMFGLLLLCTSVALAPAWGQNDAEPFSITVSADKSEVNAESDVWIKLEMTNTSKEVVDCSVAAVNGTDRSFQYEVRDSDGKAARRIVRKHSELEGGGSRKFCTLEPGGTTVRDTLISSLFDMSRPGKYSIQVSRRVPAKPKEGVVKSNTIIVTVIP